MAGPILAAAAGRSSPRDTPMRRCFALIELLVVLVVLAVLAGLLFPVFAAARDKARQAICLSNVRQLSLAFAMYLLDCDGHYPGSGDFSEASRAGWVYVPKEYVIDVELGALFRLVRNRSVFSCPGGVGNPAATMDHALGWRAEATVAEPAQTVLLLEETAGGPAGRGLNDGTFFGEREVDHLTTRHAGGGNVTWMDGRAGWQEASRRWNPAWFGAEVQ